MGAPHPALQHGDIPTAGPTPTADRQDLDMHPQQPSNSWNPPGGTSNSTPLPGAPSPIPDAPVVLSKGPMRPVPAFLVFGVLFGGFVWLVVGLVGYNAASSFGPRVTEDAEILSIERDFNSSSSSSVDRTTLWVEGETESGRSWRFASDEIYDIASREGYPMDVEVTISTWTGSTIAVRGDGFEDDRSSIATGVVWVLATLFVLAIVAGCAWLIRRKESMLAFVSFFALSPLWLWVGFIVMRWIRT